MNLSTTPVVQYAYNQMSGGANNSRLTNMTYPNGRVINYNYNSGLDSSISRLSSISDSTGILESYLYLGLDTVVERDHPQTGVNETYISQNGTTGDAGDMYIRLGSFWPDCGRQLVQHGTGTSTDRFQYGYDADGDVLWRNNLVNPAMGELYTYDGLNQVTSFQRGTLNSTDTGIVGTPSVSESWTYDALGNWLTVTTNGTEQTPHGEPAKRDHLDQRGDDAGLRRQRQHDDGPEWQHFGLRCLEPVGGLQERQYDVGELPI